MVSLKKILLLFLLLQAKLFAIDATWTGANNGNWNNGNNWSTHPAVPNGTGDTAHLNDLAVPPTALTISLDTDVTLAELVFNSTTNYTITPAAAQTLTLNTAGSSGSLTVASTGAHTIGASIIFVNQLTVSQGSTGVLTLPGAIANPAGMGSRSFVLANSSTGTVALTGVNTFTGDVLINGGTLQVSADTGFGDAANPIFFDGAAATTLQIGANFSSARTITLDSPAIIDTQNNTLTLTGQVTGVGSLTKVGTGTNGSGTLGLSSTLNDYTGGTFINAGTISISDDRNLGFAFEPVAIADGATLQMTASLSSPRPFTLTGNTTIDTTTFSSQLTGAIGGTGSLTKISSGTLTLSPGNNYQGGTLINGGTLSISNDSALGLSTSSLTIGAATLQTSAGITSARAVSLTGAATINTTGTNTFTGIFSGTGSLTKTSGGTLILTGANSYTGGTTVSAGTLQGDTNGLQGNISNGGATVTFSQTFNGTYAGSLSGSGTLTKLGTGAVTFTGNSLFSGATNVTAGSLIVNGSLGNSSMVTVSAGATVGGAGTIGSLTNSGTITPGNSIESLTVNGTLNLAAASSVLNIEVAPLSADQLIVTGTVTALNGSVAVTPTAGFYGTTVSYPILTSASLNGHTFTGGVTTNDSNFQPTLSYTLTDVILDIKVLNPFLGFSFSNANTQSVGENLSALSLAGTLSATLTNVINSFVGLDNAIINAALDEMHPAQYSALTELHSEVSSYLASYFHRKPYSQCVDNCGSYRFWLEPFSQWLEVQPHGLEIGFGADTSGLALGWDKELTDRLSLGVGGAYQKAKLKWHPARGHSEAESYYGALYGDYANESFYWGFALLAGQDFNDSTRHIQFTTFNEDADAHFRAFDITSQLSTAYFFGSPAAYFFPYANLDFFYQKADPFQESGANGLDLSVQSHTSKTLRTEMGLGLAVNDRNYDETICISPFASLGWAMVAPIERPDYTATFEGGNIAYSVKGWDHTWQLFKADFGLKFAYHCFTFGLEYHVELSPDSETTLFNQVGNASLQWQW